MTQSAQPPFIVYVMWHPDFVDSEPIADTIHTYFLNPRLQHAAGGQAFEVRFYKEKNPSAVPVSVAWDAPCPIAIVVLIDHCVANTPEWIGCVRQLGERTITEGLHTRMIPVTMEHSVLEKITLDQQVIRWDKWTGGVKERKARLMRELTYEFARMFRHQLYLIHHPNDDQNSIGPYLDKIRIFLSHSKHDKHGANVAGKIRRWLHSSSTLSSFMDVYDIPPGLPFAKVIEHSIEHSVMLVVYTDSYSSREWCHHEVIAAKRHCVPMVVVDCLHKGDERAFPYLGNVPVIRMNPMCPNRIPNVVSRLLVEILGDMLWKTHIATLQEHDSLLTFIGRPPEFVSLASRGLNPDQQGVIVYPDPPLSNAEEALIGAAWNGLKFLSMSQWLAEK